jgi:hypothetical protein
MYGSAHFILQHLLEWWWSGKGMPLGPAHLDMLETPIGAPLIPTSLYI